MNTEPRNGSPLYKNGECVLCRKMIGTNGRASHGMMHHRKNEVMRGVNIYGGRWQFYVMKKIGGVA